MMDVKKVFFGNVAYEKLRARLKNKQTASIVLGYSSSTVGE